jgi:broad-specificity NMP kinase
MPYILKTEREKFDADIRHLVAVLSPRGWEGELNYVLSTLLNRAVGRRGVNYVNINALIGVLECCKLELYRRLAEPYEDTKIVENGDIELAWRPEDSEQEKK